MRLKITPWYISFIVLLTSCSERLDFSKIEDFAKEEGCKMMELIARPGWQKVLNIFDYKRTHVVLEKKIKQENKI